VALSRGTQQKARIDIMFWFSFLNGIGKQFVLMRPQFESYPNLYAPPASLFKGIKRFPGYSAAHDYFFNIPPDATQPGYPGAQVLYAFM
jgi:hypothetical protein